MYLLRYVLTQIKQDIAIKKQNTRTICIYICTGTAR